MADAILDEVNVGSMFDLRGVVAVVTGGGTVCQTNTRPTSAHPKSKHLLLYQGIGVMMATTLMSNGATVYIIGPSQRDLDKCVPRFSASKSIAMFKHFTCAVITSAQC